MAEREIRRRLHTRWADADFILLTEMSAEGALLPAIAARLDRTQASVTKAARSRGIKVKMKRLPMT